jgi:methionyl-tRNA formyltransferase
MRILFAGSPAIAVPALESVVREGFDMAGLLTNPDSPRGRSGKPEPTDCAAAALRFSGNSFPLLKPEKLDGAAREQTAALKPDILVSFAYGTIFGPKYLALFPLGGINIHPSLLPRYRGPTPIPAAILNRETVTGITIQRLAAEMDSGDILAQEEVPLTGRETTASLSAIMAQKAAGLLPNTLRGIAGGTLQGRPQDHGAATYCSLIEKKDGKIDWSRSAVEIDAQIRAFDPWPLSWTNHPPFNEGKPATGGEELQLFILKAEALEKEAALSALPGQVLGKDKDKGILIQTGKGILAVSELQYRTKKALDWKAFLNGTRNFIDVRLGFSLTI